MLGKRDRWQEDLFVQGPLGDLVPEDYVLRRVDGVLDLSWLEEEVRDCYDESQGRPSIAPEAALRLMLAGFLLGIVHDRALLREAQVNLAIRWFAGYGLHERLPDHSSLTRIRQRWGAECFQRILGRTVKACTQAGLMAGETLHVDATLIQADVSWESLSTAYAEEVWEANQQEEPREQQPPRSRSGKPKKRSRTDPDATLATNRKDRPLEPCYKQHSVVDGERGVIVDVEITTGEAPEGERLAEQLGRAEAAVGVAPQRVTADSAYAQAANYAMLEEKGIEALIPPPAERRGRTIPLQRFRYDARHDLVRCPRNKVLRPTRGGWYRARPQDCRNCPLRARCLPPSCRARSVRIVPGYPALLRARRRKRRWDQQPGQGYRQRWRIEGVFAEAKVIHKLARAVRRGLPNVAIQAYLTAAAINLKRLAALLFASGLGANTPHHSLLRLLGFLHHLLHPQQRILTRCSSQ